MEEARKREDEFKQIFSRPTLDLATLRSLSWKGIPSSCRAQAWMFLIGYLPTVSTRRDEVLARKRAEYKAIVEQHFHVSKLQGDPIYKQVKIRGFWPIEPS